MEQDPPDNGADERQRILRLIAELQAAFERAFGLEPTTALPEPPPKLGDRMLEFLKLLCDPQGYTYKEIAHKMKCSTSTLRTWRERLRKRFGVRGRSAIVGWAVVRGLG